MWLTELGMIQYSMNLPSLMDQSTQMMLPLPPISLSLPTNPIPPAPERQTTFKEMIMEGRMTRREGMQDGKM